jgi:protein involved in temperature-dependent protein secretion
MECHLIIEPFGNVIELRERGGYVWLASIAIRGLSVNKMDHDSLVCYSLASVMMT